MPARAVPACERFDRITQTAMRPFLMHEEKGVWRCGSNEPRL